MSRIVKVVVKNVIDFEVDDNFVMTNYDKENFLVLAKKAMMQIPQSGLMNDAKYKIKNS